MFGSVRFLVILSVCFGLLDRAQAEANEMIVCFRWDIDTGCSPAAKSCATVEMECGNSSMALTADLTEVAFYKRHRGRGCPESVEERDCLQSVDKDDIKYTVVVGGVRGSTCPGGSSCLVYYDWPQNLPVPSDCRGNYYVKIQYTCESVSERPTTPMDNHAPPVTDESSRTTTMKTANEATEVFVTEKTSKTSSASPGLVTTGSSSSGRKSSGGGLFTDVVIALLVLIPIVALLIALIVCCWKRNRRRKDNDESPGTVRWSSTAPPCGGYVTVDSEPNASYAMPSAAVSNALGDQSAKTNRFDEYANRPTSAYAEPFQPIRTVDKPDNYVSGDIYAQPIKSRKPGHAKDGQRWNQAHAQTAQRDISNGQDFIMDNEENDLILTENDLYSPGVHG